jgi:hypothetical protein
VVVFAGLKQLQYVQEWDDEFLALFPHRFDYIYASHSELGQHPQWQTESRHPLSDRVLRQGSHLFGVRFGAQTQYCLLDIDIGSLYHPQQDQLAIGRILTALEAIGIVTHITCTSSYSGGLHLYFPLATVQSSWELATIVSTLLENSGFILKPGQLEVFPNSKPYLVEGTPSLFNAHRLPIQAGSYLLNEDFQPIWGDQKTFVTQWYLAQKNNNVDAKTIKQILKQAKRKHYRISGKADKFINDLNAEIETGWTGAGQTNRLLGRITMRAYIFQHLFSGSNPLEGEELVKEIVSTAKALPGYSEWCNHQHEIEERAEEWAHCIQNSHYFHYGDSKGKYKTKEEVTALESTIAELPSWNQQQSQAARERIRSAIAQMLEINGLPSGATARFHALTSFHISGRSLYRHRDLWHPQYLVENPPDPPISNAVLFDCAEGTSNNISPTSLLHTTGDNPSTDAALSYLYPLDSQTKGDNTRADEGSRDLDSSHSATPPLDKHKRKQLHSSQRATVAPYIQPLLFDSQCWLEVTQEASKSAQQAVDRLRAEAQHTNHVERMQQYLTSGDPILIAEALAWDQVNLGVLNLDVFFTSPSHRTEEKPHSEHTFAHDLSDILVAIAVQVRRLQWTPEQMRKRMMVRLGKSRQSLLDDLELLQWLEWLEQLEQENQP